MADEFISFRVSNDRFASDDLEYLKSHGLIILVQEEADAEVQRTHMHGVMQCKYSTIRKWFQRKWPGNEWHSTKKCEAGGGSVEGAFRYVCKGKSPNDGPVVLYQVGIDVAKYHNDYWAENKTRKSVLGKRKAACSIIDQCYEGIKEEIGFSTGLEVIGEAIITWYLANNKRLPSNFAMESMVRTYVARQNELQEYPVPNNGDRLRMLFPRLQL